MRRPFGRGAGVVAAMALAVVGLSGCGVLHPAKDQLPVTTPATPVKLLPVADQTTFENVDHAIVAYCRSPSSSPPAAITHGVDELIAIYRAADPRSVAPGPLFQGQTARQVLGDFGGLLKAGCARGLGAQIGAALSATPPTPGNALPAADQATFESVDHAIVAYCRSPHPSPPAAITRDVHELIAIYRSADPRSVAPGPIFRGQTARQVLGDFGGLLKAGCARGLGAQIEAALSKR